MIIREDLSPLTAEICGILLPRLRGQSQIASSLVSTSTTSRGLISFAEALLTPDPILLTGLAGSGKTLIAMDAARELNAGSSMLTLHLNEQTDAKLLVGMYATGSVPGSFEWRPGVLTTAVREGRWVFIEDLDRAPTDVLSAILPLVERRELLIPSRGEKIRAARGFKLIATIRSTLNNRSEEVVPGVHMLGMRLWRRVHINMPSMAEFHKIIGETFPILRRYLSVITNVYSKCLSLYQQPMFASANKASMARPLSPRDLMKWCRRMNAQLSSAGLSTGQEPITDFLHDVMFMEAADCFAGSLQTHDARRYVVSQIAAEMHVPPQRVNYYLDAHVPRHVVSTEALTIGRAHLRRQRALGLVKKKTPRGTRPFATTTHTLRLMEQIAVAVQMSEPVLLVGETGTGKTSVVQQLAGILGHKLIVLNLSQQSESGDLLGGYKPVNIRSLAVPMKEDFDDLFESTFSMKKNQRYMDMLGKCVAKGQWARALTLWREALKMVEGFFASSTSTGGEQPKKRRKLEPVKSQLLRSKWEKFSQDVDSLNMQLSGGSKGFAFKFVEGKIVKAARKGEWVLLDEINLASPDTLESIADLLYSGPGGMPSILLSETGDVERVQAHPDFRIFGAMNPATDIGKKDLPMGLRSRFAEIFVDSPDRDFDCLLDIAKAYLIGYADERAAHDIVGLYLEVKRLANENRLVDGANQRPHFSLRTLTRTLSYVVEIAPMYGLRRALYEGFSMAFLTLLDKHSERLLFPLIDKHLLGNHHNARSLLNQTPKLPDDGKQYVQFKHYWMPRGNFPVEEQPHYIITPFVERNMLNLIRATSTRRFPVLVQGPTSSGKTSMIEYLAKITGNKFVRINNHEHTDLQEYLGSYISDNEGQLRFREGILVQALREGHWIVLDELNLAPTDVLEALNRLLDDNRELLIPETQEVLKPNENFMLFATQNPPGLYGGRKILSRAFRNRFLELHFDDIPEDELETILRERSQIAPSFCARIVAVYKELSLLRQSSRLFEQKNSFATLRDLFRWAHRDADSREQLAANGFMLLAERVRKPEERLAVKQVIEKILKVKIDEEKLYDANHSTEAKLFVERANSQGVVWTKAMGRLFVLVSHALKNQEPVLLVGETGCGKTTACQKLAESFGTRLFTVNAHQNMETGDLIGAQRPLRNRSSIELQLHQDLSILFQTYLNDDDLVHRGQEERVRAYKELSVDSLTHVPAELRDRIQINMTKLHTLFEWSDGSLVHAMKTGQFFLLDEISLADDSVLERLNSVLEPQRSLLLAEKGPNDSLIKAAEGFQFLATMNPGGDYGKRELSPALRNRFTEIWVPSISDRDDALKIVVSKIRESARILSEPIVEFASWFCERYNFTASSAVSIRDILAWVHFVNSCQNLDPYFGFLHGAAMVFIDTIGANPAALLAIPSNRIYQERKYCLEYLSKLVRHDLAPLYFAQVDVMSLPGWLSVGPFLITKTGDSVDDPGFNFGAPTTKMNALRVLRALQLQKPILLEGNPGVGKTTLIAAIAQSTGRPLTRINLSEQTDLMDLFGSDVPVEGADAGHFVWCDAPFLQAMQNGGWVLLDEMNLASQSVLEGLNACLDHRGEVYISELDQTFTRHPDFAVFAAQNPHHQGGGRKGLPSSFVNRFTVVYTDLLTPEDLMQICWNSFPTIPKAVIEKLILFVAALEEQVVQNRYFGARGSPWEFNLRDIIRWLGLLTSREKLLRNRRAVDFLDLIFKQRFRCREDRLCIDSLFSQVFEMAIPERQIYYNLSQNSFQVGLAVLSREPNIQNITAGLALDFKERLPELESLMVCVQQNWPCILAGPSGSGKTTLIRQLAAVSGACLVEFPLNPDVDTMDLVGGYEQVDPGRLAAPFFERLELFLRTQIAVSANSVLLDPDVGAARILDSIKSHPCGRATLVSIHEFLVAISLGVPSSLLADLISQCSKLLEEPLTAGRPCFQWVDGILVEALEQGKWLVLDNANLCSSSVLDRLNSLLEPNGYLSINEHRSPGGDAKVVKPHPAFRIFLTMDPKHGELSRAMRNRAIEIYLAPLEAHGGAIVPAVNRSAFGEASKFRFRLLAQVAQSPNDREIWIQLLEIGLSHLSLRDMGLLSSWDTQVKRGLIEFPEEKGSAFSLATDRYRMLGGSFLNGQLLRFYSHLASELNVGGDFSHAQVSCCAALGIASQLY
jgi:midasin